MVARAREALRAGNPAQAIALLDEVRTLYPSGVLVQERELLWIESLVRSGQRAPALERAQAFVRTWPESPYTARVRELAAMP
jgi:outer membrane protein assembly factor BamD (BamD/ComL family)